MVKESELTVIQMCQLLSDIFAITQGVNDVVKDIAIPDKPRDTHLNEWMELRDRLATAANENALELYYKYACNQKFMELHTHQV